MPALKNIKVIMRGTEIVGWTWIRCKCSECGEDVPYNWTSRHAKKHLGRDVKFKELL